MSKIILDSKKYNAVLKSIAKDIIKKNKEISDIAIVGIHNKGVFLAKKIIAEIANLKNLDERDISFGTLDVTLYRDDLDDFDNDMPAVRDTVMAFDMNKKNIILVDDVLYTGRTTRAALEVITDFGRPKSIQLAVLIDRGFRELPIEANYVGLKYESKENIKVECSEIEGQDRVIIIN